MDAERTQQPGIGPMWILVGICVGLLFMTAGNDDDESGDTAGAPTVSNDGSAVSSGSETVRRRKVRDAAGNAIGNAPDAATLPSSQDPADAATADTSAHSPATSGE